MIRRILSNFFSKDPPNNSIGLVVSFPKCGRTWLRVMLDEAGVRMRYTHAGSGHSAALHYKALQESNFHIATRPVVFLMRNPKDVVVSGFFQATKRLKKPYTDSLSDFVRDEKHGIKKIISFYEMWLQKSTQTDDILIVTYEELHENPEITLKKIMRFLGIEIASDSSCAEIVKKYSFENMQKMEASGAFSRQYGGKLTPSDRNDPESFKARRGKVGGYTTYLSTNDIRYCQKEITASVIVRHYYGV